ncbi:hypothetical protein JKY72_00690, partial [Candidatus Gracilibacteria bacterium]|nr:hypothetical protein [Candidatus Gracilibacteria bacterium]
MGIGFKSDRFKMRDEGLFAGTNELTKSAIAGSAFLAAIGAMKIDGLDLPKTAMMGQVQQKLLTANDFSATALMEIADSRSFRDSLHENICLAIPVIERGIVRERMRLIGVMPAGRKVHARQSMDEGMLSALRDIFSLYNTCFHLIHAGETMVMDPLPTSYELDLLTEILTKFGVIDRERPTLQFASGGRLSEENAPYAAVANLLGASRRIQYEPGAFTTSHDETGARILAYDAGVKKSGLPFDLPNIDGRTDIMGRRDYDSARRYQLAGTVLAHLENGGRFADEGRYFVESMRGIIRARGLTTAFESSAWVFDHAKMGDGFEAHDSMVGAFTGANWDDAEKAGFGVIAEVRRLERELEHRIQAKSWQIELEEPDEVALLRKYGYFSFLLLILKTYVGIPS